MYDEREMLGYSHVDPQTFDEFMQYFADHMVTNDSLMQWLERRDIDPYDYYLSLSEERLRKEAKNLLNSLPEDIVRLYSLSGFREQGDDIKVVLDEYLESRFVEYYVNELSQNDLLMSALRKAKLHPVVYYLEITEADKRLDDPDGCRGMFKENRSLYRQIEQGFKSVCKTLEYEYGVGVGVASRAHSPLEQVIASAEEQKDTSRFDNQSDWHLRHSQQEWRSR